MKTKIKNEFQNPDLIFGNEIQKRKFKIILTNENQNCKMKSEIEIQKRKSNLKRMIDYNKRTIFSKR